MRWPLATISSFCRTGSGGTPSTRQKDIFYGGDIPWVKSGELKDDLLLTTEETLTEAGLNGSAAKWVPAGAILIAMYGATVGKTAILGISATTNQAVCNIVPDPRIAESKFIWYALRVRVPQLLARRVGGAQPNISQKIIRDTRIPLAPLSEQRRIVEILDQADELRKKRAKADAKAARILPALFYKMFGDPATNPLGWKTGKLGVVILETQYGTSTRANTGGEGLPVIRMNNINLDGYLDLTDLKHVVLSGGDKKKCALADGDILFNRTNSRELVGKTGLWRGEMAAVPASYLIRVRVDRQRALPEFIWAYMNCPFIKQMLRNKARRAIGMANINARELRSLPLVLPGKDWQEVFAQHVARLERLRQQRMQNAQAINRLFYALLHRAFTGDLTAKWREAHMKELLAEMEAQAKALAVNT
jgi:type I restriction enzyme S subunit